MMTGLPSSLGLVGLVAIEYTIVLSVFGGYVGAARKKYGVPYPTLYAVPNDKISEKDANAFNCVQRGHQNAVEHAVEFFVLLALAAVSYPLYAAIAGQIYIIGRILYFQGYSSGDPKNRARGSVQYLGLLPLLLMAIGSCTRMR